MSTYRERCTSILILAIVSHVSFLFVAFGTEKRTSTIFKDHRDAISMATERILQKDRDGATKLLSEALKREKKDSLPYRELIRNMDLMREIFLTEKGQELYEMGKALLGSDFVSGSQKLREAMVLEAGNQSIVKTLARAHLARGECGKTLTLVNEAQSVLQKTEQLNLLTLQALACLGKIEEFKTVAVSMDSSSPSVVPYIEMLRAQVAHGEERFSSAIAHLDRVKNLEPSFPEVYYWYGQIFMKTGKSEIEVLKTYVKKCAESEIRGLKKKYELEPRTCLERNAVEAHLESRNKNGL